MFTIIAIWLLASAANAPSAQNSRAANSSVTHPLLVELPKNPYGLTLYNDKGEVVARCKEKDEIFQDCKVESGVTLDDLMNAWVHAYLEAQK
jgi:hypothetical protein